MNQRSVSIYQVAKLAEVSAMTVARAFNGKQKVAPATKTRIMEAARTLGYQPNRLASNLRLGATNTIGIMWSFAGPHSNAALARNFSRGLLASGYVSYICDTLSDPEIFNRFVDNYIGQRVDGLIIQISKSELLTEQLLDKLRAIRKAVIVCEEPPGKPVGDFDVIFRCHLSSQADLLGHFVATGRKKIMIFGKPLPPKREKYLAEVIARYHSDAVFARIYELPPNATWDEYISGPGFNYDAIFAVTDELATCLMSHLTSRGVRVPEDIAVAGFNDNPVSRELAPPLASVERRDEEIARAAVKMLLERLNDPDLPPRHLDMPMRFILRESAGLP